MGGIPSSTMTSTQISDLTKTLSLKYEEYKDQGLTDSQIYSKISGDYNDFLSTTAVSPKPKIDPIITRKDTSDANEDLKNSKRKDSDSVSLQAKSHEEHSSRRISTRATPVSTPKPAQGSANMQKKTYRRRSFDMNPMQAQKLELKLEEQQKATLPSLTTSLTSKTIEFKMEVLPEDAEVDNWDSVTQQPFCNICQMAFKSPVFLERHQKYSELHAKNIKQHKEKEGGDGVSLSHDEVQEKEQYEQQQAEIMRNSAAQKDGEDYKLLYTGSKLFWRTKRSLDLHIYHHLKTDTVEIISFDLGLAKELERIYLNYSKVYDLILPRLNQMVESKFTSAIGDRFNTLSKEDIFEENKLPVLTTYIIQRIQEIRPDEDDPIAMAKPAKVEFVLSSADDPVGSPHLPQGRPTDLIPIAVPRRRRTTDEEFQATYSQFSHDADMIENDLKRADSFSSKALIPGETIAPLPEPVNE